jgi:hypothetical protein
MYVCLYVCMYVCMYEHWMRQVRLSPHTYIHTCIHTYMHTCWLGDRHFKACVRGTGMMTSIACTKVQYTLYISSYCTTYMYNTSPHIFPCIIICLFSKTYTRTHTRTRVEHTDTWQQLHSRIHIYANYIQRSACVVKPCASKMYAFAG